MVIPSTSTDTIPLPHAGRDLPLEWPFEALYHESIATAAKEIEEFDHLAPLPPLERQVELPTSDRDGPGGRIVRPPPEVDALVAIADALSHPRRWGLRGDERVAALDARELAERLQWVYEHRKRGLSPWDYAVQREWTQARSVNAGWWLRSKAPRTLPTVPEALGRLVGNNKARRDVLGLVTQAARCGYLGVTGSGPDLAALLGCAVSTFWAAVAWLESRGLIVRMRRYKPGKGKCPVGLNDNWYGPGPELLRRRELWNQGDLDDEALRIAGREAAKARARHRRTRHRIEIRRGRSQPTGRAPVSRVEWLESHLDGAARAELAGDELAARVAAIKAIQDRRVRALVEGDLAAYEAATAEAEGVELPRAPEVLAELVERWRAIAWGLLDRDLEVVVAAARALDRGERLDALGELGDHWDLERTEDLPLLRRPRERDHGVDESRQPADAPSPPPDLAARVDDHDVDEELGSGSEDGVEECPDDGADVAGRRFSEDAGAVEEPSADLEAECRLEAGGAVVADKLGPGDAATDDGEALDQGVAEEAESGAEAGTTHGLDGEEVEELLGDEAYLAKMAEVLGRRVSDLRAALEVQLRDSRKIIPSDPRRGYPRGRDSFEFPSEGSERPPPGTSRSELDRGPPDRLGARREMGRALDALERTSPALARRLRGRLRR